jgi:hypothetical protein
MPLPQFSKLDSETRKSKSPARKRQRFEVIPNKENATLFKERKNSTGQHGKQLRRKIQLPHWLDIYSAEVTKGSTPKK